MGFPWAETISGVTAVFSAAAAGGSWKAARRANATADTVARIEQNRWHAELTPQFDLTLTETGGGTARLTVHLNGPDELGRLDDVWVSVGNDDMDHAITHGDGRLTQEDLDAFVWGPFRFRAGIDGADADGRGAAPFPLLVGRGRPLAMERTRPGLWMTGKTQEAWQQENVGNPVRIVITCRRGEELWAVARRVDNPPYQPRA
jgi:hypothetical protein